MSINEELLDFLYQSPTAYQAVDVLKKELLEAGFEECMETRPWELAEGGKYFATRNGSSLIAWEIPVGGFHGFCIGASHCDSPSFKVKENPELVDGNYVRLNVEPYGGMLRAPWLDRPLSVAGRVLVKSGDMIRSVLINVDRDLLTIPHLAIHMDKKQNEGHVYNPAVDMVPLLGSAACKGMFMKIVAESAGVKAEDIVGHDLFLYVRGKGYIWGAANEYISAGHLDDLQCTFGNFKGFMNAVPEGSIPVLAVFDNEEVGSLTKQGALSSFLRDTLKRICAAFGISQDEFGRLAANSFMVSADNAHAVHPDFPGVADPVNRPQMNKGIVLKYNAAQHYTTDGISGALFKSICEKENVPVQVFTNRSDMAGGGTLGNLANAQYSLNTVDIGLPQLAMHSCWETAGVKDTEYLAKAMKRFFSSRFEALGYDTFRFYSR